MRNATEIAATEKSHLERQAADDLLIELREVLLELLRRPEGPTNYRRFLVEALRLVLTADELAAGTDVA